MEAGALYRIINWLSPAFPVGAFAYSHGIEWAVENGDVQDRDSLAGWVGGILSYGAGRVDGAMFCAAWRTGAAEDLEALDDVAAQALAWRGTAETAMESGQQGKAFADVTADAWNDPRVRDLARRHEGRIALPVAAGLALSPHVRLKDAVLGYLSAFAANLVNAGVRLIPLGQTDGQAALVVLEPVVRNAAEAALAADPAALGTAAPMTDLASIFHETQYSRMFRS